MRSSNSALRAELGTTLRALQASLLDLSNHLQEEARDVWAWHAPELPHAKSASKPPEDLPRDQALELLAAGVRSIKYEDDQHPHESRIYPGIVAVSSEGIALTDAVNRHKTTLARVLREMDGRIELGTVDPSTGARGERPLREVALEAFYFRRLQHWQATRRLEVLRETPEIMGTLQYVGFMWATSREVRRTTRERLIKEAEAGERVLSEEERDVLASLPANEPLAIVRPGHTTPKANIRWISRDGAPPTTKVRIAVLPLMMLGDHLPERLRRLPPRPRPKNSRAARTDIELEPTPLLRALGIHRYLKPVRASKRRRDAR